jgi:glycoprotein endo-alpha-1,2-mannosidase
MSMSRRAPVVVRGLLLCGAVFALASAPAGARPEQQKPLISIFYYPWYATPALDGSYGHWADEGHLPPLDVASSYYPHRGPYSSSDPAILRAQMSEIGRAGIGQVVVSWWGWGSPEDARLPAVLRAARNAGLDVAIHLEPYEGRTAATVEADIEHLRQLGIRDYYVYRPFEIAVEDWTGLNDRLVDVRVFAQTTLVGWAASGRFQGLYTYDVLMHNGGTFRRLCNQARVAGLVCAPSVGPGYDARRSVGDLRTKPRRRGTTYDAMWRAALGSGAEQVTITSYNEWLEGTQIEAARPTARANGFAYATYAGAWGLHGTRSVSAYMSRTGYWTRAFANRASRSTR